MKLRLFAMLLVAASVAACESSTGSAGLEQRLLGTWVRMEPLPDVGAGPVMRTETWSFDGSIYTRSISDVPQSGGTATGLLTEVGTYTLSWGELRLTRQSLFERQPGTSPPAGSPETQPKPVTPLLITTHISFHDGRLVLGGCQSTSVCIPGPYEYGGLLTASAN
jgi:hypothetical protein